MMIYQSASSLSDAASALIAAPSSPSPSATASWVAKSAIRMSFSSDQSACSSAWLSVSQGLLLPEQLVRCHDHARRHCHAVTAGRVVPRAEDERHVLR
jgi:hypothetical protein